MAHSSRDAETAAIMGLAPVIPVLSLAGAPTGGIMLESAAYGSRSERRWRLAIGQPSLAPRQQSRRCERPREPDEPRTSRWKIQTFRASSSAS